jgi:hypothetical protein
MSKVNLAKFRKTAEVVNHNLSLTGISFVESIFGETFYLSAFDNTAEEKIIVTGGSKALVAQLKGIEGDDIDGLVVVIRERGKSYEITEFDINET